MSGAAANTLFAQRSNSRGRTEKRAFCAIEPSPRRRSMRKPPSPPEKSSSVLTREQSDEVLRYWLASLRLEEALQVRPQARRSTNGPTLPRLDRPTPGQDYFKLPLDAALAQLLSQQIQLKRPFDAELAGFFETWLDGQYRRGDDEGELSHLLCFPVLHLPRGELAGLVRCGVRLRFGSGEGKAFRAPSRAERARASYPQVPDEVRLTRAPRADGAWPFFIDSRLLRQPLGVSAESIDALFEALRTLDTVSEQQMLALLTTTLERSASGTRAEATADADQVTVEAARLKASVAAERCEIETWLGRLTSALRRLLGQSASRAQVYPVGIVVDGTQAKTTWHLQRELNALLDAEPEQSWKLSTPLGAYLTGRARPAGEAPQRALFPGPALSQSQRAAAEHFWGSSFSAVQGPPGTGKTSLILHLCAEALVRQVEPLLDGGRMGNELFVIASSNNRAVDNVIEPLTSGDGLPLALRAGSRQVCEQQLAHGLRRTLAWLKRAELEPLEQRSQALIEASRHFQSRRAEIERRLAPRREAQQRRAARAQLERALEASSTASEPASTHARSLATLSAEQMSALSAAIAKVEKRLHGLSRLCEAEPTSAQLEALGRHYKRTTARHLPELVQALSNAQLTFELPLPPPMPAQPVGAEQLMESWEEATELCLGRLGELRSSLERAEILAKSLQEQNRLRAELAALGARELPVPEVEDHEALSRELFHAAVGLREAWASQSAAELGKAVSTALRTVEQERSLRPLFRNELQAVRALCRLFGIWGSTLALTRKLLSE